MPKTISYSQSVIESNQLVIFQLNVIYHPLSSLDAIYSVDARGFKDASSFRAS
jgi:hypothetical protein